MNKQIEEMARAMCRNYGTNVCVSCDAHATCMIHLYAEDVYNEGYRKQSEGEWKIWESHIYCSQCLVVQDRATPFCPNCGAKMKGGAE